ncbi:MAG TPA: 7-carboxy-7-deazaguanine synthase QueE [candidate division Zixibacteria bacterium]|nr:7-carboxy-7-deazaguanine synthase QueE [candidate division Zixibacteria bacterium]
MRIAEIFYSIQGEGRLAGVPSAFVRTSGCNLRCAWCDTPYTSWRPTGREWSVEAVVEAVRAYPTRHAVITGGEPLIARDIEALASRLKDLCFHVTIETAATLFKPVACDLLSISPKLANSTPWKRQRGRFANMHEGRRLNLEVIQRFVEAYDYQLKFVVEDESDLGEVEALLERLHGIQRERVLLMAQARTRRELRERGPLIAELCRRHGYAYSPRLQIDLYGNRRGT